MHIFATTATTYYDGHHYAYAYYDHGNLINDLIQCWNSTYFSDLNASLQSWYSNELLGWLIAPVIFLLQFVILAIGLLFKALVGALILLIPVLVICYFVLMLVFWISFFLAAIQEMTGAS
jgi:hypothetical protein